MKFNPCTGNCTEDGTHCEGCGRSHEEIAETRQLIGAIADYAAKMGYENVEDFTQFVAIKAFGKVQMMQGGGPGLSLNNS